MGISRSRKLELSKMKAFVCFAAVLAAASAAPQVLVGHGVAHAVAHPVAVVANPPTSQSPLLMASKGLLSSPRPLVPPTLPLPRPTTPRASLRSSLPLLPTSPFPSDTLLLFPSLPTLLTQLPTLLQ